MFIAHIPASYLCTSLLIEKCNIHEKSGLSKTAIIILALIMGVIPDIDLFYFYLIDHRQHNHHTYWTHLPFFWLVFLTIPAFILLYTKQRQLLWITLLMGTNIFLHLILDTYLGRIQWLQPISTYEFYLFDVPAVHKYWVWNFVLHWTFIIELLIASIAVKRLFHQYRIRIKNRY